MLSADLIASRTQRCSRFSASTRRLPDTNRTQHGKRIASYVSANLAFRAVRPVWPGQARLSVSSRSQGEAFKGRRRRSRRRRSSNRKCTSQWRQHGGCWCKRPRAFRRGINRCRHKARHSRRHCAWKWRLIGAVTRHRRGCRRAEVDKPNSQPDEVIARQGTMVFE